MDNDTTMQLTCEDYSPKSHTCGKAHHLGICPLAHINVLLIPYRPLKVRCPRQPWTGKTPNTKDHYVSHLPSKVEQKAPEAPPGGHPVESPSPT